jgi:hypothetical protein
MDGRTKELVEKAQIKDTLEQLFNLTLEQKINRQLELRPHGIIPNSHFAAVSAGCYSLYTDGHFYGTISLTQALAEALLRFLCEKNDLKVSSPDNNVGKLKKKKLISTNLAILFNNIRKNRDDYHHLNPQIEQDRQKLATLAKEKLTNLRDIQKELFAYSVNEGKLIPRFPKYWI